MLRNVTMSDIIWAILIRVPAILIASILYTIFEPYIRPPLESLLPSIGEQIQSLHLYLTERDIRKIVRFAASGIFDGTQIVGLLLAILFLSGFLILQAFHFDAQRRRLIERENPMKLRQKIVYIAVFLVLMASFVWVTDQTRLVTAAVLANKAFERNLAIISPFVSDQEEKQLRSSWALMKTLENVKEIDAKMLGIAQQNGLSVSEHSSGN